MGLLNRRRKNKMGRMYSKVKGIARRCLPYRKAAPSWVRISSNDLVDQIIKLTKKALSIRKHLEKFRKDRDAKFRLIMVESRIHRLARYYRNAKALPPTWRYNSKKADTLI